MLNSLIALSNSNRVLELERRQKNVAIEGDFDGSVTGSWVRLGTMGEELFPTITRNTSPALLVLFLSQKELKWNLALQMEFTTASTDHAN